MAATLRPIYLIVGILLATLGAAMYLPAIVDFAANNRDWEIFAFTGTLTLLIGLGLYAGARNTDYSMSSRQAFVMTVSAWLSITIFGALPYYFSGVVPSYTDAFFESMSGITTTGSTVITGLDDAPPGILLWRGIQQWLGGLGIIVMAVAVLPMLQVGGMQLFKIEAFDTAEKILPRAAQISGSITFVFIGMTALCIVSYFMAGMSVLDAVIHGLTTVSTGGFSSKDNSLGHYNNEVIELICILFMILGSLPFILMVQFFRGSLTRIFRNSQVQVFFIVLSVLTMIAWSLHPGQETAPRSSFIEAAFSVTSMVTGTGFSNSDFSQWAVGSNAFFFAIMFIGGCAGSTSCGIKIFRFQIMFETIKQHLARIFYPNGIFVMRFNGSKVEESVSVAVMNFFAVYFLLFGVFAILLNFTGLDFITAMSAAGTAISNVGPGVGPIVGPAGTFQSLSDPAKWIMSAAMLVGRLELFTVLVLFMPRFWRG